MEFIHCFDKDYSPLDNAIIEADKINKLMNTFPKIMEAMNEKKKFFIDSYQDKARKVMRRLAFTPNVGARNFIVQKRPGYTIIQNKKATVDKGKQIMGSTTDVLEERPDEPSPKRQRIMKEHDPHFEEYSPTQSPVQIGEDQLTGEQIEKIGSQGGVFITQVELDEGNPQEPPMPSLDLTVVDYRGRELDPVLEQASHQFLSDDSLVRSRAFH